MSKVCQDTFVCNGRSGPTTVSNQSYADGKEVSLQDNPVLFVGVLNTEGFLLLVKGSDRDSHYRHTTCEKRNVCSTTSLL